MFSATFLAQTKKQTLTHILSSADKWNVTKVMLNVGLEQPLAFIIQFHKNSENNLG